MTTCEPGPLFLQIIRVAIAKRRGFARWMTFVELLIIGR
jgi:hypothetical protein